MPYVSALETTLQLVLETPEVTLLLAADPDRPVRIAALAVTGAPVGAAASGAPIVEVFHAADAHGRTNLAWQTSAVGERMRYVDHRVETVDGGQRLTVEQHDPASGLTAIWSATALLGVAGIRAVTTVRHDGTTPVRLEAVSSLSLTLFAATERARLEVYRAHSEWLAEYRWRSEPLSPGLLMDVGINAFGQDPRGRMALVGRGTWSTGEFLPSGILERADGHSFAWQVESSGAWAWELTERELGIGLTLTGPTDHDSSWSLELSPGEEFVSVPASIVVSDGGWNGALRELTTLRRGIRRPHPQDSDLPVVYNDYMNTIAGDPTEEKLLPLIDAAAEIGADVFCIDAGWYDKAADLHDNLGEWTESPDRFPTGGLAAVLDRIRERGMTAGLWLEPEVVGVQTRLAASLPEDAFWGRGGHRLKDWGRYHLDLRHPAVRERLDATIDDLIGRLGIGYTKFDYNADLGSGTDRSASSTGQGGLESQRALHEWISGILDRHPEFVIESCSSGAMRADYGLLALSQLQSTSDQQDAVRYAAIACASPSAMVPEQAANWAYPQPDMSDEQILFCLANGMLTRLYLSGWIDRMTQAQHALVRDAVSAHKSIRHRIARSLPRWPLGLPGWTDEWLALVLDSDEGALLTVWHRPEHGTTPGAGHVIDLPWPGPTGQIKALHPVDPQGWETSWRTARDGSVSLVLRTDVDGPSARTFSIER
ncbi:glycoside hydrolase family 36 protein [Subtercola endophyticus]|uniref:glycoside hydrolase family 36 protein n=1 Tax=Subtercola endophyticus TaxID=2895559 RepID=UPI001E35FB26|nr:glycoside hydrolase family 36 protein [Subtercola endophyticus]UFS60837.1 alpha-galactosidase [Subtercola endophyticus]